MDISNGLLLILKSQVLTTPRITPVLYISALADHSTRLVVVVGGGGGTGYSDSIFGGHETLFLTNNIGGTRAPPGSVVPVFTDFLVFNARSLNEFLVYELMRGFQLSHRQPKLIVRNLQNVGHYNTLYWGFTLRFLKIVEYYYCGNKVYLPSVHLVLVCCVQFERNSRSI